MNGLLKYQRGAIYTIRSPNIDKIYIGSTVQSLSKRLANHWMMYQKYREGMGRYRASFEILEAGDSYIEMLEVFPCECKRELNDRVDYWIKEFR